MMAMTKPVTNSTTAVMTPIMTPNCLFWALICAIASSSIAVVSVSVEVDLPDESVGMASVVIDVSPFSEVTVVG